MTGDLVIKVVVYCLNKIQCHLPTVTAKCIVGFNLEMNYYWSREQDRSQVRQ